MPLTSSRSTADKVSGELDCTRLRTLATSSSFPTNKCTSSTSSTWRVRARGAKSGLGQQQTCDLGCRANVPEHTSTWQWIHRTRETRGENQGSSYNWHKVEYWCMNKTYMHDVIQVKRDRKMEWKNRRTETLHYLQVRSDWVCCLVGLLYCYSISVHYIVFCLAMLSCATGVLPYSVRLSSCTARAVNNCLFRFGFVRLVSACTAEAVSMGIVSGLVMTCYFVWSSCWYCVIVATMDWFAGCNLPLLCSRRWPAQRQA